MSAATATPAAATPKTCPDCEGTGVVADDFKLFGGRKIEPWHRREARSDGLDVFAIAIGAVAPTECPTCGGKTLDAVLDVVDVRTCKVARGCTRGATHGPADEPIACESHAGDWPPIGARP